ncbi:MAG: hypothetical protein IPN66_06660 [Candidatus Competibacteraceae bacterium]|nr:hypothetical protein [Candidatus Competibacteraceae bacterium]MBK8896647.1 hypothetical protein [Candidatus Competibacteraceae bacterium]MBK8896898.1 hypothetical protein [Candidatus Competibacteraceae bacterium]
MTDTTTAMLAMLPGAPGEAQLLGAISRLPAGAVYHRPGETRDGGLSAARPGRRYPDFRRAGPSHRMDVELSGHRRLAK